MGSSYAKLENRALNRPLTILFGQAKEFKGNTYRLALMDPISHKDTGYSLYTYGSILGGYQLNLEIGQGKWVYSLDWSRGQDPDVACLETNDERLIQQIQLDLREGWAFTDLSEPESKESCLLSLFIKYRGESKLPARLYIRVPAQYYVPEYQ